MGCVETVCHKRQNITSNTVLNMFLWLVLNHKNFWVYFVQKPCDCFRKGEEWRRKTMKRKTLRGRRTTMKRKTFTGIRITSTSQKPSEGSPKQVPLLGVLLRFLTSQAGYAVVKTTLKSIKWPVYMHHVHLWIGQRILKKHDLDPFADKKHVIWTRFSFTSVCNNFLIIFSVQTYNKDNDRV